MRVAEHAAGRGVEAEPARGEHPLQVTVADDRDVAVAQQRPDPVEDRVRARSHLLERLAGGRVAAMTPSRHRSQPGLVARICSSVMPS